MLGQLGVNGVFIFTGVPGRKHVAEIEAGTLMRNLVLKNQVLFGTVNADADAFVSAVQRLQRMVDRWPEALQHDLPTLAARRRRPIAQRSPSRRQACGQADGVASRRTFQSSHPTERTSP